MAATAACSRAMASSSAVSGGGGGGAEVLSRGYSDTCRFSPRIAGACPGDAVLAGAAQHGATADLCGSMGGESRDEDKDRDVLVEGYVAAAILSSTRRAVVQDVPTHFCQGAAKARGARRDNICKIRPELSEGVLCQRVIYDWGPTTQGINATSRRRGTRAGARGGEKQNVRAKTGFESPRACRRRDASERYTNMLFEKKAQVRRRREVVEEIH